MSLPGKWIGLIALTFGLCVVGEANAQQPDNRQKLKRLEDLMGESEIRKLKSQAKKSSGFRQPQPTRSYLDANNSTITLDNDGLFAFEDPFTGNNGSYPKGTAGHTTFAQGLMFGGKVKDGGERQIRVGGSTYVTGLKPGGLTQSGMPEDRSNRERFHVWRVHRNWTQSSVVRESAAYREGVSATEIGQSAISQTRDQYAYDWNNWPADDGAPYEECNGEPGYQPADPEAVAAGASCTPDELDGDIPGRPGADQTIWIVTNDMGSESLQNDVSSPYASPEIGVEVQYTLWSYARPPGTALGNINFINAQIVYAGKPDAHPKPTPPDAEIDSMFISWWVDPDVGTFSNDFAGSDPSKDLGFAYNSSPNDALSESIGLAPPAVGFDFLEGPVTAEGDTLGLSSFTFFAAGTAATDPALFDYTGTLEWFNLMRGVRPQPPYPQTEPFINPITDQPATYANNGDPVTGRGWIDGEFVGPSDRRIVNTSGPFEMAVGDTVDVTVAQVKAQGSGYLSSVSLMRFHDQAAQFTYDQDFNIPSPPASPEASASALDEKVVLNWGSSPDRIRQIENNYSSPPGFEFQGYRVYQLPTRTASLDDGTRIATFDEDDGVRRLRDNVFNEQSGVVEERTVQILNDTGMQRHLVLQTDEIREQPLANSSDYYYAVTSFGYLEEEGTGVPSRVLESSPTRLTVRPQPPAPGVQDAPEVGQQIEASQSGDSDTSVDVEIVDPPEVVDAEYNVTFGDSWNLNQGGSEVLSDVSFGDSRIVNGLLIEVTADDQSTIEGGDEWTFSSNGSQEASQAQLKQEVKEIGVFPNPYRGFSQLEDSRFDKFVRFTNLPSPDQGETTIRLFTLNGTPVRVLRHDETSVNDNYKDWNLKNENDTFVATGIYIAHISTPNGEKVLKVAIAMEDEVLPTF